MSSGGQLALQNSFWVSSLYISQAIGYALINVASVLFFKDLGFANEKIAFWTSLFNLPWVLKPLWSPVIEKFFSKRTWSLLGEFIFVFAMGLMSLSLFADEPFAILVSLFLILALNCASCDMANDGFYILALKESEQSFFSGFRNTFFRIGLILGESIFVILAGFLQDNGYSYLSFSKEQSWQISFLALALIMFIFFIINYLILPYPKEDKPLPSNSNSGTFSTFIDSFIEFFKKPDIIKILLFILFYRFAESQLSKIAPLFLMDTKANGAMELSISQIGQIKSILGTIFLLLGGILGGIFIAKKGLKFSKWLMVGAMNLPNLAYLYMAIFLPQSKLVIGSLISLESFGYGFGFSFFMVYLLYVCSTSGKYKASHYAICTGFMALSLMLPSMASGFVQEYLGYKMFFTYIMFCCVPSFFVCYILPMKNDFGKLTKI